MIHYPKTLQKLFFTLSTHNIKPIIVGGYIRDMLLDKKSKDIDIELYGVNSLQELQTLLKEFGSLNSVGKSFGVSKLTLDDLEIDFSLPREESKIADGHKGFNVTTHSHLDFTTAASRRDFTINAIGYDVFTKRLLDPFNGQEDLQNSYLRAVDIKKFAQDPLRILRAMQFSARFHLDVDEALLKLCQKLVQDNILQELPKERIFEEFKKLLLKSDTPSLGILLLQKMGAFKYFQELQKLSEDNLHKSLKMLDYFAKTPYTDTKLLSMFLLLSAKLSIDETLSFLNRLTNEKEIFKKILQIKKAQNSLTLTNVDDYTLFKLASKVELAHFLSLIDAAYLGEKCVAINRLKERAKSLGILHQKAKPLLHGKDIIALGFSPSKSFSLILNEAYEEQMHQVFKTYEEALTWLEKRVQTI